MTVWWELSILISRVSVAKINDQYSVVSQYLKYARKYLDQTGHVFRRTLFETDLSVNAVIAQAEVWRGSHAHLHPHLLCRKRSQTISAITKKYFVHSSDPFL